MHSGRRELTVRVVVIVIALHIFGVLLRAPLRALRDGLTRLSELPLEVKLSWGWGWVGAEVGVRIRG